MKIEQNTISRDWLVKHKGKEYHVNFTYSDGQTLAIWNREYWEVIDEDGEEFGGYIMGNATDKDIKKAEVNVDIKDEIIKFCVDNFLTYDFKNEVDEKLKVI